MCCQHLSKWNDKPNGMSYEISAVQSSSSSLSASHSTKKIFFYVPEDLSVRLLCMRVCLVLKQYKFWQLKVRCLLCEQSQSTNHNSLSHFFYLFFLIEEAPAEVTRDCKLFSVLCMGGGKKVSRSVSQDTFIWPSGPAYSKTAGALKVTYENTNTHQPTLKCNRNKAAGRNDML